MMRVSLSQADVERLLKDPSAESRRDAATKVAVSYTGETLSPEERMIAEDILRLLTSDVEVRVREALAENLKSFSGLSRDIAVKLASDVDSVALPVIRYSEVLTDDDLIEIINTQAPSKQTAVAQRYVVSEQISDLLVDTGNEDVVVALVGNDGAQISDSTFGRLIEDFGNSEAVTGGMVHRKTLPVTIAERLVHIVSERLRDELVSRHELPENVASDLILQSRERTTLGLLAPGSDILDIQTLVTQLNENGRLTPSIILRAICMGDIEFFEVSTAVLAQLPLGATRALIHDKGMLGLPAVVDRAGLPANMMPLFRAAIEVANETEYDGGEKDRERFRARILERILTFMDDPAAQLGVKNAEYLLEQLCGLDVAGAQPGWQIPA